MSFHTEALKLTGRRVSPGEKPSLGMREREDMIFQVGTIEQVNVEKQTLIIKLHDNRGTSYNIPITQPYSGVGSFISSMPEEGSTVILAVQRNLVAPIAYIPRFSAGLEPSYIKRWPDNIDYSGKNDFFYRLKPLRPGEVSLGSSGGTEFFLGDDAYLEDGLGDKIFMRSSDQSIISTSLNNYIFSSGVWINAGTIQRNSLGISNLGEGHYGNKETLKDGRVVFNLRPGEVGFSDDHYTEYTIEVEDQASGEISFNDVNNVKNTSNRNPVAIFSLGNFAGNNPNKRNTYGKLLGVSLFKDGFAKDGNFDLVSLTGGNPEKYGMAITLYKPQTRNYENGAFFGIDKEGHFYQYIPAASGGGLGGGRSMSILAKGNKKEIWGKEDNKGNSWDLVTEGGVKWVLGKHTDKDRDIRGRSLDIRSDGMAYYRYGQIDDMLRDFKDSKKKIVDLNPYKKIEKVGGSLREEITGSRETIIQAADRLKINGMKEVQVTGAYALNIGTNMNVSVSDSYSLKVVKQGQEAFGSRITTITNGSSELIIDPKPNPAKGDIKEIIKSISGNRSLTIQKSGNITEEIKIRGNRSFKTTTGNFSAEIKTKGNVSLKTKAGKIIFQTVAGEGQFKASTKMLLQARAGVIVEGATISLKGAGGLSSGVITRNSHRDYITGAPLIASNTVKATI